MPVDHTKNIVEVEHVSFAYERSIVLKDVSLAIHQGDYLGIVGPNGSGKTTLLKIMLGLFKPQSGNVKLFGVPVHQFQEWSKLGYVSQKAINFDPLFPVTVQEVVAMGRIGQRGLLRRLTKQDHATVAQALHQVEMWDYRTRLIGDLSSGQQQRIFIARALAGEPEVIFLDEPTVGVDVKTQENFYTLLQHLNQKLGITLVLISHDIDVLAHEVTELACINQTLIYHGEPKAFVGSEYMTRLYGKDLRMLLHEH